MIVGSQGNLGILNLTNKEFKNELKQNIEDNFINVKEKPEVTEAVN